MVFLIIGWRSLALGLSPTCKVLEMVFINLSLQYLETSYTYLGESWTPHLSRGHLHSNFYFTEDSLSSLLILDI